MHRITVLLAVLLLSVRLAHAAGPKVDLALVLVDDVSGSINDDEFALQKKGYVAAFTDPRVIAAIAGGEAGAIAVAYVEFASNYQVRTVLDWHVIKDAASAKAFANALGVAVALLSRAHLDQRGHRPGDAPVGASRFPGRPEGDRRLWRRHQQLRTGRGRRS